MLSAKRNKVIFPSSAAETIANNDDLLIQILLCLPIKSLFKFKSVSKHWLSLITNPLFSRRLFPSNSPCALCVRKSFRLENEYDFIMLDDRYSIDAPFKALEFVDDTIRIIQSCNGLLLCSSVQFYLPEAKYYVYNPTINQYAILPRLTVSSDDICGLYLAFDPLKSPDYKVICLLQSEISEPEFQIEIYSSKTHEWKVSDAGFTLESLDIGIHGGVFCNGAIHWYTDFGPSFYLDIDKEQVKEMAMPATPEEWYRRRVLYFGECKGHLYLVEIYNAPSTKFNVCEMEKDYSRWIVKYKIDLDGIARAFPGMIRSYLDPSALNYYVFQTMYIVKGERDEDVEEDDGSYLVLHIPTKIIRYNLKDKSFKKLCDFCPYEQEDASYMIHYGAYEYIQSLACV